MLVSGLYSFKYSVSDDMSMINQEMKTPNHLNINPAVQFKIKNFLLNSCKIHFKLLSILKRGRGTSFFFHASNKQATSNTVVPQPDRETENTNTTGDE